MPIRFSCPQCGKVLNSPEGTWGRVASCPQCGQRMTVPASQEVPPAAEERTALPPPYHPPPVRQPFAPLQGTVLEDENFLPEERPEAPAPATQPTVYQPVALSVSVNQSVGAGAGGMGVAGTFGVSSLILGILGLFLCWVPALNLLLAVLALVLGVVGLYLSAENGWGGLGFAIAGSALSLLDLVLSAVLTIALFMPPH